MVYVTCNNEDCDDELMKLTNTDSRQEWCEKTYECLRCGAIKVHRTVVNWKWKVDWKKECLTIPIYYTFGDEKGSVYIDTEGMEEDYESAIKNIKQHKQKLLRGISSKPKKELKGNKSNLER